ncbi:MAG: Nucleotidyltransferase domain protein [Candidatus Diapherotrites archaeon ADurb.Bin253]|nr:MAG: Nucleotidyltransferase domain protein [Candidatus Diapherotrites archaeon ADurb.Bin253]HOF44524.1 nucleotidyltransferase domain-containing protein [Candidatus Pacearchaeota archaeon]HOR52410.1 nucleotidyltransferase domain-containing protein [Candidatus Pacearchaeota archaeon]HOU79500.1 nucleotidyltransferase domain-containing protein [Candidatus Pacearchaeota archaeon]HPJ86976.1 nucleotidyltransferase domain-containing protein [Candidatus Pacearchaeota archaeon]
MLTKKQLKILNTFQKNKFKKLTWKQVKELSRENSSSVIQDAIKAFLNEELITEEKIGTSKIYAVNHKNNKVYTYFEIYNKENLSKQVLKSIKELEDSLDKHTYFYSIVIFGSFVSGEQKKDSDLDIAVFIEQENKRKIVEAVFKSMETKSLLKIDGHVITKDEFLEMLNVDYENLGKEIARKHLIVHNPAIFYSMLNDGIKHGFKL